MIKTILLLTLLASTLFAVPASYNGAFTCIDKNGYKFIINRDSNSLHFLEKGSAIVLSYAKNVKSSSGTVFEVYEKGNMTFVFQQQTRDSEAHGLTTYYKKKKQYAYFCKKY